MKKLLTFITIVYVILSTATLLLKFPAHAQTISPVVINEFLPNPIGTDAGNEWVELYNFTNQKVLLDGWSLRDKTSSYPLNGKSIEANSYIVVFPAISLNNADEELTLTDDQLYFDYITYTSSAEGKSLERVHTDCTKFLEHPTSDTKGVINFNYDPYGCTLNANEQIEIFTKGKDSNEWRNEHVYLVNSTIQAKFDYKRTDPISKIEWSYENSTFSTETAEISLNKVGLSTLKLRLTTSSETFSSEVNIVTEPNIKNNEVFPDPEGSDSGQEWIELYNPTKNEANLNNWVLNIGSKSQKINDLKISPKGFIVITTSISVPNTSAEISLISPNGLIVDSFQYNDTEPDKSWARIIDGEGDWFITDPTKGKTNAVFQENGLESQISGDIAGAAAIDFVPELTSPNFHGAEQLEIEDSTETRPENVIKTTEVNELAFAGFFIGETGIFAATLLRKEELAKVIAFLMGLFKG